MPTRCGSRCGTPVADVCGQTGVSEATFYVWKKKYANLGVMELRKLKMLEEENARLKRLVADLTLDRHIVLLVGLVREPTRRHEGSRSERTGALHRTHAAQLKRIIFVRGEIESRLECMTPLMTG